ncbi:beta-glucosidase family protein [Halorubrum halodurans]|uniref:Glycosyl hydrolase n=1 Tax=Halorubrum halodurans TaxID=1383851 RepID=A0A256IR79_9EURY|nr:glycoside hydrolase family 3 C-terminal domain-containing protein [Halorubrum halodurans]OYR58652.1 glycosyl hydrolase [Halorubrum halodurans]
MTEDATIRGLVEALTLEETVRLVSGTTDPAGRATGYLAGVDRLDVPPLTLVDGPLGVRIPGESATAFPAPTALAATFDADLAREHGAALGREARAAGADALLAPGTNLIRVPQGGRNFEYFAEDPVLSAATAAGVVEGIASADVIATPKHYVANAQETDRVTASAEVDERALRELYLPSFRAAVAAGAGSVMSAYNRVNGTRMSDHRRLLTDVLKGEWGFDGYVVSDWYGTEGAVDAAAAGLDVEMPGVPPDEASDALADEGDDPIPDALARGMPDPETCEPFDEALPAAVRDGSLPRERLDDMAARVLRTMDRVGLLDGDRSSPDVDTDAHRRLAFRVATRGSVLLENDGVLPLSADADVALVGPAADEAVLGGGGSSETTPETTTTPRDGIEARADGDVTVAPGHPPIEDVSLFDVLSDGEEPAGTDGVDAGSGVDVDAAVAAAEAAAVAVVVVRDTTTEALDRDGLGLPGRQDELIEAVAAAADRTVVAIAASGPVELPWRDAVDAVLLNWYPGQVHGDALAALLYGDADPGGRLPVTFAPDSAYPTADRRRFSGVDGRVSHDEGVLVGYRWFDARDPEPTYPFGHGRSYATFAYHDAVLDADAGAATVTVTVENVADRDGREVVQTYVRPPRIADVERPVREFAGAESVALAAGETESVTIRLDELAFSRYDPEAGWTVDEGEYVVEVGRSARDARIELTTER